ncbi:GAF sensor signal transduction histidine kinase [Anaeromyxobacter sp. K]|uniref:CHASE domain-containing sensor histidine kinase n=1 Tax=Anaeromyxobacter sp. (strain K) TaxID=447217 RepID=UPI00017BE2E7|nr:CHASE domain-containing protein [Anaeromyxobacter sp. K]ACG73017.1 GAF sensor signal transduction histidine kinase [Anaeromyxobacter sp. K]
MPNRRRPPAVVLRTHAVPAAVAAISLAAALASWQYVRAAVQAQEAARFRERATAGTDAIRDRMNAYVAMLRATRGFVEATGGEPDRIGFRAYVQSTELTRYYRGIQGLGWSRALLPGDLEAHVAAVRAQWDPGYRVWPEGERALYSSIVFLEPLDWRNRRAIGFDMFSEPVRRAAMERARDSGDVAASGPVELVQEAGSERQPGFLVYLPVYARAPRSLQERRELLRGWVYAPFRATDLLRSTLDDAPARTIGLAVYDGESETPDALLYDDGTAARGGALTTAHRLEVAGRTWTVRHTATAAFVSLTDRALPGLVLGVGAALTVLLFWITRSEVMARGRAEQDARRTAFLAAASQRLASDLDYRRTLPDVARLAAERVADACVGCVVEPTGPLWFAGHRDPARAEGWLAAAAAAGLDPEGRTGIAAALSTGQPHEVDHAPDRLPHFARSPAVAARLREERVEALLSVPLVVRGEPVGAVTLLSAHGPFDAHDRALAEDLARLLAAAVDTARLTWRAQDAVRVRDEFLSIASHELKTPLTSLALQSDSLRASAGRGDAEALVRKSEVIRRSVDRLTRLVASLLDLSRINAGRLELELEPVDLAEVARDVVARFEEEASRAACPLSLEAPEPVVGRWDRVRLDQVLTNLLGNAVKYGPGRPVEVRVRTDGDRALLSVRDHGIGISAADQRRIFERFERAVSRRHYGGFGLGLWIVREIVEVLGGTVRVESTPGAGSTFTVTLSRAPEAAATHRAGAATTSPPPTA